MSYAFTTTVITLDEAIAAYPDRFQLDEHVEGFEPGGYMLQSLADGNPDWVDYLPENVLITMGPAGAIVVFTGISTRHLEETGVGELATHSPDVADLERQVNERFGNGVFDWTVVRSGASGDCVGGTVLGAWFWFCGTAINPGTGKASWAAEGEAETIVEAFTALLAAGPA